MRYIIGYIIGYIILLLIFGILLPVSMAAQPMAAQPNPRVISLNIITIGDDTYNNGIILSANVSLNVPGNIRYVEEYYKISGNSNPIFVSSGEYYNGGLIQINNANGTFYNTTFQFTRPRSNLGKNYQIIKEIVLLDNIRIFENWNDRNQTFNDNTPEGIDDNEISQSGNIVAHETREQMLSSSPSTFRYTSLDSIYEVNATGKGDASIRIDIFKDAPMATYLSNGVVYRYVDLGTDNLNIYNLSFRYKTEISWIQNQSIKTIGLFAWKDDEKRWDGLPTTIIDQDSEFVYLESVSNSSLSSANNYFAIIGFGPSSPSSTKALSNPNLINNNEENSSANNTANNTANNNMANSLNNSGNSSGNSAITGSVSNNYSSNISAQNITPVQTDEPLIKNIPGFDFLITIIAIFLMVIRSKKR